MTVVEYKYFSHFVHCVKRGYSGSLHAHSWAKRRFGREAAFYKCLLSFLLQVAGSLRIEQVAKVC